MNKRFLIIDGNSLLFRAYYATAYKGVETLMRTSTGVPTNALYAFSNMIIPLLNTLKSGDHVFVAFDTGHKTFRHEEYQDYKATRGPVPDELITQFPLVRELLDVLGVPRDEIVGYEADDLAGTLAKIAAKAHFDVELYTSDQDYFQLIDDRIVVKQVKKGISDIVTLDSDTLYQEFGYYPWQVPDFKGLTGDPSDNLKGIPGVGKVTAVKLLKEFESLEGIIENSTSIKGKLGENIRENIEVAKNSKYLATILLDAPIDANLSKYEYNGFDIKTAHQFIQKYELKSILSKLKTQKPENNALVTIGDINELKNQNVQSLTLYPENDEENYYSILAFDLILKINNVMYKIPSNEIIKYPYVKQLLESEKVKKYGYDIKRTLILLAKVNIEMQGEFEDLLLLNYLIDSNSLFTLKPVLLDLGYSGEEAVTQFVGDLEGLIAKKIEEIKDSATSYIYNDIEKPLTLVLTKMERQGFSVDKSLLETIGAEYKKILEEITRVIFNLAGHEFNINSPKQVAEVIFDELKLPSNRKRSTAVDVLNSLKDQHPIILSLLEYRKYQKIVSTYIEGLQSNIYEDGKVHTSFNQAVTTTGRLSSINPNLQNISVRNEEGKLIRKAFYEVDYEILSIDYSQIELRLLADMANVKTLIDVFNHDRDIHTETANLLFPLEDLEYARRKAKAVNFGIVYGQSDFGLAEQLEINVGEARHIIQSFFQVYPEINAFRQKIVSEARENGFVTTLTGRKRYIPEINDAKYQVREFGKRAAMNAPIQGSAADLIKIAMIEVDKYLTKHNTKSKLLLQVHDELIFALDKNEHYIIEDIKKVMENVMKLKIPLKVGVSVGQNWFDAS